MVPEALLVEVNARLRGEVLLAGVVVPALRLADDALGLAEDQFPLGVGEGTTLNPIVRVAHNPTISGRARFVNRAESLRSSAPVTNNKNLGDGADKILMRERTGSKIVDRANHHAA